MRNTSDSLANIRPGRSAWVAGFRFKLCRWRTWLFRFFKCRFLQYEGFVRLPWSVDMWSPNRHIILGHHVQFGPHTIVHCDAEIGNYVLMARNVALVGRDDHRFDIPGKTMWESPRGDNYKVVIEDDVWVGHGAIILSGVTIGRGSVIAVGSVVTQDVPPYSIVAGNPARVIKSRFSEEGRRGHETMIGKIN